MKDLFRQPFLLIGRVSTFFKNKAVWILTAIMMIAIALTLKPSSGTESITGNHEMVRRGDLIIEVPAIGSLVAARSVDITAPISSDPHFFKIAKLAPEGSRVQTGQPLIELDTQEVTQKLTEYRAELNKTKEEAEKRRLEYDIQLRDLRVRLEQARVKLESARLKINIDRSLISLQELKRNQLEMQQAEQEFDLLKKKLHATDQMSKAELSVFETNLEKSRLRVKQAESLEKKCIVSAPIAGTVIYKTLANGEKRKVGEQTCHHETILQIPDISTLRFEASVEESFAGRINLHAPVRIKLDAMPDERLVGKVVSVGTMLRTKRPDTPVKVVDVIIELDHKAGNLSPGMTATGQIGVERINNVLLIPIKAVQEKEERVFVRVIGLDGHIEERTVSIGRRNQTLVEVTEGVSEGDRLML